ncbi:hypothetical protein FA15DRAFT_664710 [Coprinopsis marcescibilis]|uniref:Uncharacterized protein n=1 Tax=Coprinopsis marcescibilis TaxID=230819 RepID=A0A5C3LAI3_COPMA|nr:hypothetical protein FA15DRAFT_664710 [Coprinopsis marcescibilis]
MSPELISLPPELIGCIGQEVRIPDAKSLRLTCKFLGDVIAHRVLRCIVIRIGGQQQVCERDFKILEGIATDECKLVARLTKELKIETTPRRFRGRVVGETRQPGYNPRNAAVVGQDDPWPMAVIPSITYHVDPNTGDDPDIRTQSHEDRLRECLAPALRSFKALNKFSWPQANDVGWVRATVLESLTPLMHSIVSFEVTMDDSGGLSLLKELSNLTRFHFRIDIPSEQKRLDALATIKDVLRRSSDTLHDIQLYVVPPPKSCSKVIEDAVLPRNPGSPSPLRNLTKLNLSFEPESRVASPDQTLETINVGNEWTALRDADIWLRSVSVGRVSRPLLRYLASYPDCSVLKDLCLTDWFYYPSTEASILATQFFQDVLPFHRATLWTLKLMTDSKSGWEFGQLTEAFFHHSFPRLQALSVCLFPRGDGAHRSDLERLIDTAMDQSAYPCLDQIHIKGLHTHGRNRTLHFIDTLGEDRRLYCSITAQQRYKCRRVGHLLTKELLDATFSVAESQLLPKVNLIKLNRLNPVEVAHGVWAYVFDEQSPPQVAYTYTYAATGIANTSQ